MVGVSVGEDDLLDVLRLHLDLEEIHECRVIIAGIHDRQIVSREDVNVRRECINAPEEEESFKKWSRGIKDPRQRLPTRVPGLLLLLDFACVGHISSLVSILHPRPPTHKSVTTAVPTFLTPVQRCAEPSSASWLPWPVPSLERAQ